MEIIYLTIALTAATGNRLQLGIRSSPRSQCLVGQIGVNAISGRRCQVLRAIDPIVETLLGVVADIGVLFGATILGITRHRISGKIAAYSGNHTVVATGLDLLAADQAELSSSGLGRVTTTHGNRLIVATKVITRGEVLLTIVPRNTGCVGGDIVGVLGTKEVLYCDTIKGRITTSTLGVERVLAHRATSQILSVPHRAHLRAGLLDSVCKRLCGGSRRNLVRKKIGS